MALDLEEQEQVDILKNWWKANGQLATTALIVVLFGLAAFNGWTYYQHKQSAQASTKYQSLITLDPKELKEIQVVSADLMDNFASTPYAGRAALTAAAANYNAKDIKSAKAQLAWAADHAKESQIQALANLQLAAIQFEEKNYGDALKTLSANHDSGFDGLFADLKGDVLVAQNKTVDAKAAYQEALTKLDTQGRYYHYTQHKLEALGS